MKKTNVIKRQNSTALAAKRLYKLCSSAKGRLSADERGIITQFIESQAAFGVSSGEVISFIENATQKKVSRTTVYGMLSRLGLKLEYRGKGAKWSKAYRMPADATSCYPRKMTTHSKTRSRTETLGTVKELVSQAEVLDYSSLQGFRLTKEEWGKTKAFVEDFLREEECIRPGLVRKFVAVTFNKRTTDTTVHAFFRRIGLAPDYAHTKPLWWRV